MNNTTFISIFLFVVLGQACILEISKAKNKQVKV